MKMGVHPVGFIYQHGNVPAVDDPHDFRQISGDSVISRIDEKDRFGIRVLPQGAFHVFDADPVGDSQLLVHHRMDKHGGAPARMMAVNTDLCTFRGTMILSPGEQTERTIVMIAPLVPWTEKNV